MNENDNKGIKKANHSKAEDKVQEDLNAECSTASAIELSNLNHSKPPNKEPKSEAAHNQTNKPANDSSADTDEDEGDQSDDSEAASNSIPSRNASVKSDKDKEPKSEAAHNQTNKPANDSSADTDEDEGDQSDDSEAASSSIPSRNASVKSDKATSVDKESQSEAVVIQINKPANDSSADTDEEEGDQSHDSAAASNSIPSRNTSVKSDKVTEKGKQVQQNGRKWNKIEVGGIIIAILLAICTLCISAFALHLTLNQSQVEIQELKQRLMKLPQLEQDLMALSENATAMVLISRLQGDVANLTMENTRLGQSVIPELQENITSFADEKDRLQEKQENLTTIIIELTENYTSSSENQENLTTITTELIENYTSVSENQLTLSATYGELNESYIRLSDFANDLQQNFSVYRDESKNRDAQHGLSLNNTAMEIRMIGNELDQQYISLKDNVSQLEDRLTSLDFNLNTSAVRIQRIGGERVQLQYVQQGWYIPLQTYFGSNTSDSWMNSSNWCQEQNANLAATGMRDYNTRVLIAESLSIANAWIGLNRTGEGAFHWLDGVEGTEGNIRWNQNATYQNSNNQDCVEIIQNSDQGYESINSLCETRKSAICETN